MKFFISFLLIFFVQIFFTSFCFGLLIGFVAAKYKIMMVLCVWRKYGRKLRKKEIKIVIGKDRKEKRKDNLHQIYKISHI